MPASLCPGPSNQGYVEPPSLSAFLCMEQDSMEAIFLGHLPKAWEASSVPSLKEEPRLEETVGLPQGPTPIFKMVPSNGGCKAVKTG